MKEVFTKEAREKIKKGIDSSANAVKSTLGAMGRNVLIFERGRIRITKDGITVAKSIEPKDKFEKLGVSLVKDVSDKTAEIAGDGTTTSAILFQSIVSKLMDRLNSGANPILLKSGMDKAMMGILSLLELKKIKVLGKQLEEVASISANDKTLGKMIADIFREIGEDGVITIEDSNGLEIEKEVVNGMEIDRGYVSPYFVNTKKGEAVLESPSVIITDEKLVSFAPLASLIDRLLKEGKRSFLIVAEDFSDQVLGGLIVNHLNKNFSVVAVKSPSFGDKRREHLEDLCVITGSSLLSSSLGKGIESAEINDIGTVNKVITDKDSTIFVGGKKADDRISQLKSLLENTNSEYEKGDLRTRIGRLTGGVSVIRVGGTTETERNEKKDRIEDAIYSTRWAIKDGILPGGGMALLDTSKELICFLNGDEKKGWDAVVDSLQEPFNVLLTNAGKNPSDFTGGVDVRTGKPVKDMIKAGIIDPFKVVETCVRNSISEASLFITCDNFVIEENEDSG